MFCTHCGAHVSADGHFCNACGTEIVTTDQHENTATNYTSPHPPKTTSRFKKKWLAPIIACLLIVALIIVLLPTTDSNSGVPEAIVKDDLDKKFGSAKIRYSISHNMDESTKIDTVTVKVTITRTYCKEHMIGTCKYRYSKSNDTWDAYGTQQWKTDRLEYLESAYTKKWDGNFKNGGTYSINITAVDFSNKKITGTFTGSKQTISMGGSRHTYTLDASGTFSITEDSEGYMLRITQSRCTFVFQLNRYYGVIGISASAN